MLKKIGFFLISLSFTFAGFYSAFAQTGVNTYAGEWEGSLGISTFSTEYSGTWQFEVDFDEGEVEGRFRGDGAGDITGIVSNGIIEASGEAAFGVVQWSGEFSLDGEEISGTWKITETASEFGEGSGIWSGSLGESEEETSEKEETEALPSEDKAAVEEETLERYPGSVALNYQSMQTPQGTLINIEYVTEESLKNVVEWYKKELGEPTLEESSTGKTKLGYRLQEQAGWTEIEISINDYTTIEVMHAKNVH